MARTPWQLKVWTNDLKTSLVTATPITTLTDVTLYQATMAPYAATITCALSDKRAANIDRGYWMELYRGWTTPVKVFEGFIKSIVKATDRSTSTYTLDCADALWDLAKQLISGNLYMSPPTFTSILDVFNGAGSVSPGSLGILNEFKSSVEWLDGINGTDGSGIGKRGGVYVDIYKGEWTNPLDSAVNVCSDLSIYLRPKVGHTNTASGGCVLQIGPLGDLAKDLDGTTNYAIWGGQKLFNSMVTGLHQDVSEKVPNNARAQQLGYSVILHATRETDLSQIYNVCVPQGKGKPEAVGGVNLHGIDGSPPIDAGGTLINGWAILPSPPAQSGGRVYYYKAQSKVSSDGHTYELVCWKEQDTTADNSYSWVRGVIDRTSAAKYGLAVKYLHLSTIQDAETLLSAALGFLDFNRDPVSSWEFDVAPAMDANGMPVMPLPGQRVTVQYQGEINSIALDGTNLGDYTYAKFPIIGDATDENGVSYTDEQCNKLARITQVTHRWSNGLYTQTLTLGKSKWHSSHFDQQMAERILHAEHHHPHHHSWKQIEIGGVPFVESRNPMCYEDVANRQEVFNPGSAMMSIVQIPRFFGDGKRVIYDIFMNDNTPGNGQYFDFMFARPATIADPTSPNAGATYGTFRVALSNSGTTTGFFTTPDGATYTQRGYTKSNSLIDSSGHVAVGGYTVVIERHGSTYEAYLLGADGGFTDGVLSGSPAAVWHDKKSQNGGSQLLGTDSGAIGWKLHGGSGVALLSNVHVHTKYHAALKRRNLGGHVEGKHHWIGLHCVPTAWVGGTSRATFNLRIYGSSASLRDDGNATLPNEDGTLISFASLPETSVDAGLGDWIIYNGSQDTITGVAGGIAPKNFGVVHSLKTDYPGWDDVYQLGRVSLVRNKSTGLPWIIGHKFGIHTIHGLHLTKHAATRLANHYHVQTRHTLHNLIVMVRHHSSLNSHGKPQGHCTVRVRLRQGTVDGHISTEDGTVIIASMVAGTAPVDITVQAGHLVIFNPPATQNADGSITVTSTNITTSSIADLAPGSGSDPIVNGFALLSEENSYVLVLDKVSDHIDAHTRDYELHNWHPKSHQVSGANHAKNSVPKAAPHKTAHTKKKRKKKPAASGGGVLTRTSG